MHRPHARLILLFISCFLIVGAVQCLAQENRTVRRHSGVTTEAELDLAFPLSGPAQESRTPPESETAREHTGPSDRTQETSSSEYRAPITPESAPDSTLPTSPDTTADSASEPDAPAAPPAPLDTPALDTSKLTQAGVVETIEGGAAALLDTPETRGHSRDLTQGAAVYVQDVIRTGPEGKVMIRFLDESTLEMGAESEMRIAALSFDPVDADNSSQVLTFLKGLLRFATGKITAQRSENLSVSSPLATIGIRGTVTDHKIDVSEEEIGGTPVRTVNSELHALRETTASRVVVRTKEGEVVLDKPDMVAEVLLDIPIQARELTTFEKQEFGAVAIEPRVFDPEVNRKLYQGLGRPVN
jgi:hypothetical protein